MGLIKDFNKYPYKSSLVDDDYLIGSDSAQNGKTKSFKMSAIKSYVGSGGTSSSLGDRNKGAGTTAPPADQEIRYNNASAASVTSIFIDDNDLDGADRSASIAKATSGILTISDKENGEDNYDKFEISGVADNTGYFTFTVTWLESKGTVSGEVNVGVDISGSGVTGGGSAAYQNTYASVPAMITGQGDQSAGGVQFVADASKNFPGAGQGDPTVKTAGTWAEYVYLGTTNGNLTDYRKRVEEESVEGGSGGVFEPVQDITALKAIDTTVAEDYPDKWAIMVESEEDWYRLDRDSVAAESLPKIVAPTTGVGRWIQVPFDIPLTDLESQSSLSVVANATNATAKPTAVQATIAERFFGRNASNILGFFQAATNYIADLAITTIKIAANAVDFTKFVQSTGNTVVGKIGAGTGDYVHTPIINIYDGLPEIKSNRTLTANTLLDNGDNGVFLDCTAGAVTAQLDDPVTVPGQVFIIMKIDSSVNAGTVDPQTYTINNSTVDVSLSNRYDYIIVIAIGSEYIKIGGNV